MNGTHIRQRTSRNLGRPLHARRRRAQTLCGAEPTAQDMDWAGTRWPNDRTHVTCERCLDIREAHPNAVITEAEPPTPHAPRPSDTPRLSSKISATP